MSTKLSKERIQQMWDYELISSWNETGSIRMWKVIHNFICKVHPLGSHDMGDVSFEDTVDYLSSLDLQRCLDVNHLTGFYEFRSWSTDVIGFIQGRCEKLSMDLINDIPKPIILLSISDYRWVKKDLNSNNKNTYKKRRAKLKDQTNKEVKARSLSKKHDWSTVK